MNTSAKTTVLVAVSVIPVQQAVMDKIAILISGFS